MSDDKPARPAEPEWITKLAAAGVNAARDRQYRGSPARHPRRGKRGPAPACVGLRVRMARQCWRAAARAQDGGARVPGLRLREWSKRRMSLRVAALWTGQILCAEELGAAVRSYG